MYTHINVIVIIVIIQINDNMTVPNQLLKGAKYVSIFNKGSYVIIVSWVSTRIVHNEGFCQKLEKFAAPIRNKSADIRNLILLKNFATKE